MIDYVYEGSLTRSEVVQRLKDLNDTCTCCLRVVAFLMHFAGYYGILYPLILILGMIPFLGAVAATVLIFIAFFFACVTYLFLIAAAWICARPLYAILIFGIIGLLMFAGKSTREKMIENGMIEEKPSSSNRYGWNDGNHFLGF